MVNRSSIATHRDRQRNSPARRASAIAGRGLRWLPWEAIVSRIARGKGFVDPMLVLKRLRSFAKPSEVGEPIELLRAGAVFHARGLVNTRAIQFNLDWVWPYWVEQQFNPNSESFIPRAFSFSHINLTHRNWTATGLPDVPHYPIVDPRGLVTPLFDGWSLDFWILGDGPPLLPSRCARAEQTLSVGENLVVRTDVGDERRGMASVVWMEADERGTTCCVQVHARATSGARLVVAVRPCNPEGVSFVDSVAFDRRSWTINGVDELRFDREPERMATSCYEAGDVFAALSSGRSGSNGGTLECPVGMATAAAVFSASEPIELRIPIEESGGAPAPRRTWRDEIASCARLQIPDERLQSLYDIAVSTVILHSPAEVYPGPYTYKRFWYRDAALILNSLITIGARQRARQALELFPRGQTRDGYFRSQEGEWDSNGQVLWIFDRYFMLANEAVPAGWWDMIDRGARWILDKRMGAGSPHPGLLPAGFSAEHLGPNDFYFWDDFWGVAGLRAASRMLESSNAAAAKEFATAADEFRGVITESISGALARTGGAIPAAPDRRMDAGAVGSLVADFPLQLLPPGDARLIRTVEWLLENSFVRGGFFQNMIHSGINAYLTLHVAQVLLRAGDPRAHQLIDATATLASSTGQWPEAIHPRTLGGCMGDGQHVWAAAEWIMMLRNLFVREEGDALVIGVGVRPEWLVHGCAFERTLTPHGEVSVELKARAPGQSTLTIRGAWRRDPPRIDVQVPGCQATRLDEGTFLLTSN